MSPFYCSYRAPIASLDCMEEFQSTNEHLTQGTPQTKEQLLQSLSQQTPLTASNHGPLVSRQSSVTPGLRYRNLGKSGLRVSNVGLGKCPRPSALPSVCPSVRPPARPPARPPICFGSRITETISLKFGVRTVNHTLKELNLRCLRLTLSFLLKWLQIVARIIKCTALIWNSIKLISI
jgi:hypothetical protein